MTPRHYEEEGRLPRFSLDRRVTVLVLFLTMLVVGTVASLRIPVELFPSGFDEPFLWVNVPWENAPTREVLDKVCLPLEEELSTVRGVDVLFSVASVGGGRAYLQFKHGTDMDVAYREVRDRIERARTRFPQDIDRVFLMKDDQSGIPVKMVGVAVDPAIHDSYDLIQNNLVQRMSRVDGVASVNVHGVLEKEILIELDREKTQAAGLNIWELAQGLGGDNFTMASGTVREGSRKLLLRSVARFHSLDDLRSRHVSPNVKLGDVATISFREPEKEFRVRAMSRPAVALEVLKEGEANVKEVSAAFDAELERIKRDPRFSGLWMTTLFDQGKIIDEALSTLLDSGMVGGGLAMIVLLFFLRRIRLTIILALAIPLSILIGMTVMYFAGESLNLLTLLGLMICVGLLVDNSVVVAENIHRLHREGLGRREACVHGAGEVGLAITMSTLTTIVVFAPVALVDGPAQFFLMRLALPVCVSVGASLVVALVFIPLCVYLTLPTRADGPRKSNLFARWHDRGAIFTRMAYEATFGKINSAYDHMLAFFMKRRLDLMLVVLLVFAVTAAVPMKHVEFVETQKEERSGFGISVEMPQTSTIEDTEAWFLKAEKVVESKKDELDLDGWWHVHEATEGRLHGWFKSPRTNDVTLSEATQIVMDALPKKPGVRLKVMGDNESRETGRGNKTYLVPLLGEDPDQLNRVKKDLEDLFVRVEGVVGVRGGNEPPPNELGLVVDRERAQRYGVNPEHVAGVVSTALMGMQLPKYRDGSKEVPVRIRYQEADRESLTELAGFTVPNSRGEMLPLSTLTDAEILPRQPDIVRRNKRMGRTITLDLDEEKIEETTRRLAAIQAGIDLPEGVSFGTNSNVISFNQDMAAMQFALAISIVLIYLLMGFLFESFILPLSIIVTIPLSIIGVYWTHFFTAKDIDFLGVVAMVLLVGVVVNNGIVLIDYVNRLRNQGQSRDDAVLHATSRRFRPIMMTAITTVGGLIPLALAGSTSIGLSYTSFAMTLIGGLTTATLLTLLVVPVLYTLFDDARAACSVALQRARAARRRVRAEEAKAA